MHDLEAITSESLTSKASRLRVAIVTETFPPEVNGVAMTLGRIVAGLLERGHTVQLMRPRQMTGTSWVREALPSTVQVGFSLGI